MSLATDYERLAPQRTMLLDRERTNAFRSALAEVVTPETVVLDVGAGSGILSILAAQAGARRVYAVERSRMAEVARKLVDDNGLSEVVSVFHADVRSILLPEKADVLVSEWLGGIGIDENLMEPVLTARDNWLRSDGTIMPSAVRSWAAPAFHSGLGEVHEFLRSRPYDVDLSRVADLSAHELSYSQIVPPDGVVAEPVSLFEIDMAEVDVARARKPFCETVRFVVTRDAEVNCFAMWFTADLTPNTALSCGPWSTTCWHTTVAPIGKTVEVSAGTEVELKLTVIPAELGWVHTDWKWRVGGEQGRGSTRQGLV